MKSATNTLRFLLSRHPDVFIPEREIGFYDVDEWKNHPDFFHFDQQHWHRPCWDNDFEGLIDWYAQFFQDAEERQTVGEVSTTYLASRLAPERIQDIIPDVKLIFLLRDPVDRAYSHYWHNVRAGRATKRFEDLLRTNPDSILERSTYYPYLKRYFELFSEDQLLCVIFENFVNNMEEVLGRIGTFLGLEALELPEEDTRKHETHAPWSLSLKLFLNRLFRRRNKLRYHDHLPFLPRPSRVGWLMSNRLYDVLSFFVDRPARSVPPMNSSTRNVLEDYFRRVNDGLQTLIDRDIIQYWPWFRTGKNDDTGRGSEEDGLNERS